MSFATVRAQPKVGVLLGLSTGLLSTVALALDAKAILAPLCIFHQWFSVQNIQGRMEMTLTSTPNRSR